MLVLLGGIVARSAAEVAYGNGAAPFADRQQAQNIGVASWAVALAGGLGAGAGAVWSMAQDG